MTTATAAFDQYASWYDAFNTGKDYDAETRYLLEQIKPWRPHPQRWLDIGCGTGNHLACLQSRGIAAGGVDASAAMIAQARVAHPHISFHVGTAQGFQLQERWDVISMLFHVMSYQTTDAMVEEALQRVNEHLDAEGLFVFDFWHTEGVLHDPPARRVRESEVGGRKLYRVAIPVEDRALRLVDIRYEFRWDSPHGECVHEEQHRMRHFSPDELTRFLAGAGLTPVSCKGWKREAPPGKDDWYGLMCATKRSGR